MEWIDVIPFFETEKFTKIASLIKQEKLKGKIVLPSSENILKAFSLTPPNNVKVVILGQDPYPNAQHAMGLAFSVPKGTKPIPPSLKNIFHEVCDDFDINHYQNPDLTRWAKQGVLLLNTSLTVIAGQPGSHCDIGWGALTNQVIRFLNEQRNNIVFILWGSHAQQKKMYINADNHLVLTSPHPSPLSAHRGFFGSRPFSQTNEYLFKHNIEPIFW